MTFSQRTFLLWGVVLILSTFQFERSECVRLCGRRLSDLLNFICEKHGGFHAPRSRRDVQSKSTNKREVMEVLWPLTRKTDPGVINTGTAEYDHENEESFGVQKGIVGECCKKQCTLATMVSYCANGQQVENIDLDEILSSKVESFPAISEEELAIFPLQQRPSVSGDALRYPTSISSHFAYSSRPNLGLSPRNRPVFIVLSQLQEDEDRELGDHRF